MTSPGGADDQLRTRATRAVGWVVLERWSARLITLLVFVVLARFVDVDDFGLISLATVFTAILTVLVEAGFAKALVQRERITEEETSTAFWASLAIGVIIAGLLAALSPVVAALLGQPDLAPILAVQGLALPLAALSSVPAALLERELRFKQLSIRQLVGTVAGAAAAIPLAILGAGAWALVAQLLVTAGVAVVVLWATTTWRPRWTFRRSALRSLMGMGLSFLGVELLNAVQANVDKLLIGVFFDPTVLGYYFLAQRVLNIMSELITSVLGRVSLTTLSKVQDDDARFNVVLRRMSFVSGAVAIPAFAIAALVAPQLLPFAFGAAWVAAVPLFQLLAPSAALASITYFDGTALLARGHGRSALTVALAQNVLGIALIVAAVPFGIAGVAIARSLRIVVAWPLRLWLLRSRAKVAIGRYLGQAARSLAAVVPVGVAIALLQTTPWATAPAAFWSFAVPVAAAALLVYAGLAWLLAGADNRAFVRSSMPARLRRGGRR